MDFLIVFIIWWFLSPLFKLFYHQQFLFFFVLYGSVWLYRHRTDISKALAPVPSSDHAPSPYDSSASNAADRTLTNLLILREEFRRQHEAGNVDLSFYHEITKKIDALNRQSLLALDITPDSQRWRVGREAAWDILVLKRSITLGPPPWRNTEKDAQKQLSLPFAPRLANSAPAPTEDEKPAALEVPPSSQIPPTVVVPPVSAESAVQLNQAPSIPSPVSVSISVPVSVPVSAPTDEAWVPAIPSALERTLQTVSGWPALLVPFLVQNILWFICGLCFVAGSTFLISSTAGQTNALAVSGVLLTYSGFPLWAGYRLCRTRPELATSGNILLALGILLIPLNIASAVRLITTAPTAPWIAAGLLLTAGEVLGFYYATTLVSGVMDRSLQGRHPQLFVALAAAQVAVPLLIRSPSWVPLAITHCVLLGLLAYSLWQFTHEWLHSILADRRKVAYYAVGTLVYATVVSFVHLTWGHDNLVPLPAGYFSPFLMVVCGLLFYVDAQIKQWTKQYAFLSYVSFFFYGLSILALLLSLHAPNARLLTLCLAIVVYSAVVWQYVTFTPLALLLICCAWLYHTLVLQHLQPQWHLLASLPGLVSLLAVSHWSQQRRATTLVSTCYWVWFGITCTVCAWSLLHNHPSLVALTTALVTMGLLFSGLRFAPTASSEQPTNVTHTNLRQSSWLYVVMLLGSLAVAYAPQSPLTTWVVQTAIGSIVLAGFWLTLGLQCSRHGAQADARQAEVLLNSTLLNLSLALMLTSTLVVPTLTSHRLLPLLLVAIGCGLLRMSLALRLRDLFYGTLILWGIAGVVLKLTYFPQPSSGLVEMFIAVSAWTLLWWLEYESEESLAIRQEYLTTRVQGHPTSMLLGQYSFPNDATYTTMLRVPLLQIMVILWTVGSWHLAARFLEGMVGWGWMCSASLGALGAVIGTGYFRLLLLFPVAIVLGLAAWLSATFQLGISHVPDLGFAGALYSFLVWGVSIVLLKHPQTPRLALFLHLSGKRSTIEASVHWTAVLSSLFCITISLILVGMFTPSVGLFCTLTSVVVFLGIAGWRYQNQVHSYLVLGVTVLTILLNYSWIVLPFHVSTYTLLRDHGLGLLASIIGLTSWAIAWQFCGQNTRLNAEPILYGNRLYHDPLCHAALLLTVFAINQALALAWIDPIQGVTIFATSTLVLASATLFIISYTLGHTSLQLVGLLATVLALLWGEALLIHPETGFTLWPGGSTFSDQWLTLSLVSGSLALVTYHHRQQPEPQLYARPLSRAAAVTFAWALCGTALLFADAPLRADLCLSLTFLALMVGMFPLVQSWAEASTIRGFALPLLGSVFFVSANAFVGFTDQLGLVALLWGFTFWAAANFALPRWNVQHPQWSVAPETWPWFGLLSISGCLLLSPLATSSVSRSALLYHAAYLTAGAAYFLLMLRNSNWGGFSWIAVFLLTRVGITFVSAWWVDPPLVTTISPFVLLLLNPPIGELLWLNALLLIAPWWHTRGEALATRVGWQRHNLQQPLLFLPAGFFALRLSHLVFLLCTNSVHRLFPANEVHWLALLAFAGLLTFSFLHLWWQQRQTWEGHALFAALSCTAVITWLGYVSSVFHFPLFVALLSAALYAASSLADKHKWGGDGTEAFRRIMSQWVEATLIAAIAILVLVLTLRSEQLLALFMLIATAAMLGWQRQQRYWLLAAGAMILVLLHDWPLLWIPFVQIPLLWPWYALQMAIVSWLVLWTSQRLQPASVALPENIASVSSDRQAMLASLLSWAWQITAGLAFIEWFLHAFSLFTGLVAGGTSQWLSKSTDVADALGAAGLLLALGARQVWVTRQAQWTYSVAVVAWAVGFYLRLVLVGLAPASAWDTTALMIVAYALFALYHLARLEPLLHVVMVMPFLVFATVPFQLASGHAGASFIAASALYLLTYRETERRLPLYLAVVAFNAALYLWIPVWAEHYNIIQLYVTPVAFSVLLLAHFHRYELKPQVLSTIRLAATTTLYVSATSDVFLHQGVGVFIVALALSLAGVFLGIAFRVRAFLYTGIASLVCNLGWQLVMLFPDQRLSQAVILLTLAALLAGVMIWFNVQREGILQRVRIFRSDLETWA